MNFDEIVSKVFILRFLHSLFCLGTNQLYIERILVVFRNSSPQNNYCFWNNYEATNQNRGSARRGENCDLMNRYLVNTARRARLPSEVFLETNWLMFQLVDKRQLFCRKTYWPCILGLLRKFLLHIFLSNWKHRACNIFHWMSEAIEILYSVLHTISSKRYKS